MFNLGKIILESQFYNIRSRRANLVKSQTVCNSSVTQLWLPRVWLQETKRSHSEVHGELEKAVIMTFPSGKWSWIKSSAFSSFFFFFFKIQILLVFHISWNVGGREVRRWDALSETSGPRGGEPSLHPFICYHWATWPVSRTRGCDGNVLVDSLRILCETPATLSKKCILKHVEGWNCMTVEDETETETDLWCPSLLFQGGKCLCFDRGSSAHGKALSGEAPFGWFSGSLGVQSGGDQAPFVPSGTSGWSWVGGACRHVTQRECQAGPISFDTDLATIVPGIQSLFPYV